MILQQMVLMKESSKNSYINIIKGLPKQNHSSKEKLILVISEKTH